MTHTAQVLKASNGYVLIGQDNFPLSPSFGIPQDLDQWLDLHCWAPVGDSQGTIQRYPGGFIRKVGGRWYVSALLAGLSAQEKEIFDWGVSVFAFILGTGSSFVYPLEEFGILIRRRYQPAGKTLAFLRVLDRVTESTRNFSVAPP